MTLTDTGPLLAIVDRRDPDHDLCVAAAEALPPGRLITTWPCFTEAMYFAHRSGGHAMQAQLWRSLMVGRLALHEPNADEVRRMLELMATYRDLPTDLADASIVAAAEALGLRKVFTLDSDFRIYRLSDGSALDVVP